MLDLAFIRENPELIKEVARRRKTAVDVDELLAIDNEEVKGPLNVVSPNPVNMERFAEAIGIILHRKSYLRVPEGAVRALFGEGAEPLLTGQRALPKAVEKLGYEFEYADLLPALESVLGPD